MLSSSSSLISRFLPRYTMLPLFPFYRCVSRWKSQEIIPISTPQEPSTRLERILERSSCYLQHALAKIVSEIAFFTIRISTTCALIFGCLLIIPISVLLCDVDVVQGRSSRSTRIADRFSRILAAPSIIWEIPARPNCQFCSAKKFFHESAGFCCSNGEVALAPMVKNPLLYHLFTTDVTSIGVRFRRRVRTYNNNFALTSIGMKTDPKYCWNNHGIYTLKVNGQVTHRLDPFCSTTELPRRLQLFFLDFADDIALDSLLKYDLEPDILELLLEALSNNPYFKIFKRLRSWENLENCRIVLRIHPTLNQKTHNLPTEQQIAAIWDETTDEPSDMNRNIVVYGIDNQPRPILYHYGCYDPLQYPLLFPNGEPGWHAGIERICQSRNRAFQCRGQNVVTPSLGHSADDVLQIEEEVYSQRKKGRSNVSCREYTCYRCQIRENDFSCIIHSGRLGQQYGIDSYIKLETQRLDYYRMEQQQMDARTESLQGIVDSLSIDGISDPTKIGQRIVLPSSFIGGPRDMMKRYINAMNLVQRYGKPDLFITMTCNPSWKEIRDNLLPCEEPQDRPELVARIFHAKLQELKDEIVKKKAFWRSGSICVCSGISKTRIATCTLDYYFERAKQTMQS